jgi:hypothetical protein
MNAHELEILVHGRLDAAHVTPETGLVVLTFWSPAGVKRLGVGVGPRVVGVGWLPRNPWFCASTKHPLVASIKAHALGKNVRSATIDEDGAVWISLGDHTVEIRVKLFAAMAGEVQILGAQSEPLLSWNGERIRLPRICEPDGDMASVGEELSRVSDGLAAELRRTALLKGVRSHAKRIARRVDNVLGDLERLEDVEKLRRMGRMLLAQGSTIARGTTVAILDDWEEGGTIEVKLDPSKPAKPQAEGFFNEAKRLQRAEGVMRARLALVQQQLDHARALEREIDGAEEVTQTSLAHWLEVAKTLGLKESETTAGKGRSKLPPRLPYATYDAWKGYRVLVGRGAADNDKLTLHVAKPHDVWMHVRGVPGAHVVIPLGKGEELAPELLIDAATLAAHHSDARGQDFVEVTWTEKRYVRKPKRSPVGRVTLDRERVLALRPEADRLARLLAAKREI